MTTTTVVATKESLHAAWEETARQYKSLLRARAQAEDAVGQATEDLQGAWYKASLIGENPMLALILAEEAAESAIKAAAAACRAVIVAETEERDAWHAYKEAEA